MVFHGHAAVVSYYENLSSRHRCRLHTDSSYYPWYADKFQQEKHKYEDAPCNYEIFQYIFFVKLMSLFLSEHII